MRNMEVKTNNHYTEAIHDFFLRNGIADFFFENQTSIIPSKRIFDLKNTEFVLIYVENRETVLHVATPYFSFGNINLSCVPFNIPFAKYNEFKVAPANPKWGHVVGTVEDRVILKYTYNECNICCENEYPICISINCFHEACKKCTEKMKNCPICREASWKVLPNYKQQITTKKLIRLLSRGDHLIVL